MPSLVPPSVLSTGLPLSSTSRQVMSTSLRARVSTRLPFLRSPSGRKRTRTPVIWLALTSSFVATPCLLVTGEVERAQSVELHGIAQRHVVGHHRGQVAQDGLHVALRNGGDLCQPFDDFVCIDGAHRDGLRVPQSVYFLLSTSPESHDCLFFLFLTFPSVQDGFPWGGQGCEVNLYS